MNIKNTGLCALAFGLLLSACGSDIDNSHYADWLGQKYNQQLKWNTDSMAFMRANWANSNLGNGVQLRQAQQIKMWNSRQTVTFATYENSGLVTSIVQPSNAELTSHQGLQGEGKLALNGGLCDASGHPASYLMIDGRVLGQATGRSGNGLIAIANDGNTWSVSIKPFVAADTTAIRHQYASAIEGGPLLLQNGITVNLDGADTTHTARTLLGTDASGHIIMAAIDGNIPGTADGVSVVQAAEMARLMGMENALCLAGGNATTLWHASRGVTNYPSSNRLPDHEGETPVGNVVLAATYKMFASGDGSQTSPYIINTARQLSNMKNALTESGEAVYFKLGRDIDMAGISWTPFNSEAPYKNKVSFDGQGHTISHLTCHNKHYPSFAGVLNGRVSNVVFADADIRADAASYHTGIVAGYLGTNGIWGEVENVAVKGRVTTTGTDYYVGGLAGNMRYGRIANCYVDADVVSATSGDRGTGGIVGYEYDGKNLKNEVPDRNCIIENCYYRGTVSAPACTVGGILGTSENRWGNYLQGCLSNAVSLIGSNDHVGIICGQVFDPAITTARFSNNYGSASTHTQHGTTPFTPSRDGLNKQGVQYHGQLPSSTFSAAAAALHWDTMLWDLSGAEPKLRIMP